MSVRTSLVGADREALKLGGTARERMLDTFVAGQLRTELEVKSWSAPTRCYARHIIWLRDRLAPEMLAGEVVLHAGSRRFGLEPGIEAVPNGRLWG